MLPHSSGTSPDPTRQPEEATIAKPKSQSQAEYDAANGLDPLIDALLEHLPAPGDYFAPEQRKLWMQLFELSLKLIYHDEPDPDPTAQPHV